MLKLIKRLLHINVVTVPKDKVRPLGWVNIYINPCNIIHLSPNPYETYVDAMKSRHMHSRYSRYLRTVYIGELPCSKAS